jgi:hypothetical protein
MQLAHPISILRKKCSYNFLFPTLRYLFQVSCRSLNVRFKYFPLASCPAGTSSNTGWKSNKMLECPRFSSYSTTPQTPPPGKKIVH